MTYNESLLMLDSKWNTLDDEQKVEVLQSIENHLALESGRLSCEVEGKFLYTGVDGVVMGTYSPHDNKIYVNSSQFDEYSLYGNTSERIVKTTIHEGRHSFQRQVVEGNVAFDDQKTVEAWKENLSDNYISYKDNPRAYYNQAVEVDARAFAEERYMQLVQEKEMLMSQNYAKDVSEELSAKAIFDKQMSEYSNYENLTNDICISNSQGFDNSQNAGMKVS